eukprot:6490849-Amphidinium_carterae.3
MLLGVLSQKACNGNGKDGAAGRVTLGDTCMRAQGWSVSVVRTRHGERCTEVVGEPYSEVIGQKGQSGDSIGAVDTPIMQCGKHAIHNGLPAEAAKGVADIKLKEAWLCTVLLGCFKMCQHGSGAIRTACPILKVAKRRLEVVEQRACMNGGNNLLENARQEQWPDASIGLLQHHKAMCSVQSQLRSGQRVISQMSEPCT